MRETGSLHERLLTRARAASALALSFRSVRPALATSAVLLGAVLSGGIVLAYILPLLGVKTAPPDEWEVAYPRLFPSAAIAMLTGLFLAAAALWPVYGLWTLLIVFQLGMAAFMFITFTF